MTDVLSCKVKPVMFLQCSVKTADRSISKQVLWTTLMAMLVQKGTKDGTRLTHLLRYVHGLTPLTSLYVNIVCRSVC